LGELSPAIIGLIAAIATKGVAEIYTRWHFGRRLELRLDRMEKAIVPIAAQTDANARELAAVGVRLGVLEDSGPVLR
jgi:IS5 family transposase